MSAFTSFPTVTRRDGWTPYLRARFLALLAEKGNVRLCAARCGRSAQSVYVQRRRDPLFAQGWDAALLLARDHAEQVLADRAIEGVEEAVFYRGEQVGTRRRFDNRLLLAHLGRLDRLAESCEAQAGAARFDELVAVIAGEPLPEMVEPDRDGPWPRPREDFVRDAVCAARDKVLHTLYDEEEDEQGACDDEDEDGGDDESDLMATAGAEAETTAEAAWDDWIVRALMRVDGIVEAEADQPGPPLEFKSLDPVNRVNFDGIRPDSDGDAQSLGMRFQASSAAIL